MPHTGPSTIDARHLTARHRHSLCADLPDEAIEKSLGAIECAVTNVLNAICGTMNRSRTPG
jgi:hypothetical protein